ncbi:C1 family peptidase [Candidatus Woesearchaeota archaeon]|nr:C1 family peptidase [Candidatus Woesearchaeota archaeon]
MLEKRGLIIFIALLVLINIILTSAQQTGCCTNPELPVNIICTETTAEDCCAADTSCIAEYFSEGIACNTILCTDQGGYCLGEEPKEQYCEFKNPLALCINQTSVSPGTDIPAECEEGCCICEKDEDKAYDNRDILKNHLECKDFCELIDYNIFLFDTAIKNDDECTALVEIPEVPSTEIPESVCGNNICEEGENNSNCPEDCDEQACYLELDNGDIKIAETIEDCDSYALAFKYADKKDALRLILKENPNYKLLGNEINAPKEEYVVKYNNFTDIEYLDYSGIKENCELIDFFGVPLYCFNGIYTDKIGNIKKNNLKSIIAPLTFLKMSGKEDMWNPLTEESIDPFDFLIKEKIEYIDGTNIFALNREDEKKFKGSISNLKIRDIRCEQEGFNGAANFQFRNSSLIGNIGTKIYSPSEIDSGEPYLPEILQNYIDAHSEPRYTVFFCRTDGKERKIHYAGILYHEANHKLFGAHVASCENVTAGDNGWKTVYGAHITYLFQASENDFLNCSERNELYDKANAEFETKLCDVEHDYIAPDCQISTRELRGVDGYTSPEDYHTWDWRNVNGSNWLTPVKDQGQCGSCWAFTAAGVIESRYIIQGGNPSLKNIDVSEQDLVSCSGAGSCEGGSPLWAIQYAEECGVRRESFFPYLRGYVLKGSVKCRLCNKGLDEKYFVENYESADSTNETENRQRMKELLIRKGPLAVAVCFPSNAEVDNITYVAHCEENPQGYCGIRHAMILVGYNDTGQYWVVKNSWGLGGPVWAETGYIKIGYGECYIENNLIGAYYPTGVDVKQ